MKTIISLIPSGVLQVTQSSATLVNEQGARNRNKNLVWSVFLVGLLTATHLHSTSRYINIVESDVSVVVMKPAEADTPQLKERAPEPVDICFVSSIFAPTTKVADRPHDLTTFQMENTTSFQFFMYTNLEDLESPGWTKVLKNFTYRRFITQSRWGKFMAWKDPEMKACQTIFYFDGHFKPDGSPKWFADLAKQIRESAVGLAQRLHAQRPSAIEELDRILRYKKDIKKNVNASIEWLQAQPDFYNNCTMYNNGYFGKSITSVLLFKRC
jgi:hypothetical protein